MIARHVRGRALAALAASGLLLAGCADGPKWSFGGEATGLAGYLATIPAVVVEGRGDSGLQISVADLDRAAEIAGVTRPAGSTDPEAVRSYLNALTLPAPDAPQVVAAQFPIAVSVERSHQVDEFAAEVGWSVADVSWFAEYQTQPDVFTVLGGDFDVDRLTAAMGERPDDGIWRLGGDDYEVDLTEVSPARPFGQALRLALIGDDQLVVSRATPPVEAALSGDATLADDPVLSALAAAMDAQEAYSATFIVREPRPSKNGLPQPFTGVAAGTAYVDDTPYALLAYSHEDEAAATSNAEALRTLLEAGESMTGTPWSEQFGVDDIQVDGTIITARLTLRGASPMAVYQILFSGDTLVTRS